MAKFRTLRPVRLVSMDTGHTALLTPDGENEVHPALYKHALAAGCVPVGVTVDELMGIKPPAAPAPVAVVDSGTGEETDDQIREAMDRLVQEGDPRHFHSRSGIPLLTPMSEAAGFKVKGPDVRRLWLERVEQERGVNASE